MTEGAQFASPKALGGSVEFAVEVALGAVAGGDDTAIWAPDANAALWDTKGVWSGLQPSWVDITSRSLSANTKRGRDRWEQQFRVGQSTVRLDNQDGIFNPDSNRPPGAVALRPGRWLRVMGRRTDGVLEQNPTRFLLDADTGIASGMEAPLPAAPAAGYKVTVTNAITAVTHTSDQPIVSAYSGNASNRLFQIEQRTDDTIRAVMSHDTTATQSMTAPGTFPPGTLLNIELVVDYTVPEATLTVNGAPTVLALTATGPNTTVAPFTIGRRALSQQAGLFWRGTMEQAAMLTLGDGPLVTADFSDPGLVGSLDGVNWLDGQGNTWEGLLGSSAEGTVTDPNVWVALWTGQIDGMADSYSDGAQGIDSVFTSLGFGARFQIDDPPALETPIPAGQLTGDRVTQLLNLVAWPQDPRWRDIDTGEHTMAESTLAQSRWAEMQVAATAEGGAMFLSGDGVATFKNRDWLANKLGGPVKFTVGAVASDVKILHADTDWSQQRVYGDVRMARKGGGEGNFIRRVSDDSIALYGPRTFQRFDLECETDNQLVALVERFLASAQFDRSRVESVDLVPVTAEGITQLLEVELGDLIRVTVQTGGDGDWAYTDDYFVQKVTHSIDADDWVTTLRIDAASFDVPLLPAAYTRGFSLGFDSQNPEPLLPATGATEGNPGFFTPPGSEIPFDFATLVATDPLADPQTLWAIGSHVLLGDTSHAYWDGGAYQVGDSPQPPATGATEGAPGFFTPVPSTPPFDFAQLVSDGIIANPLTTWDLGSHVILGDTSHAYWDGAGWQVGDSPGIIATGATEGNPGFFTPAGALAPVDFADLLAIAPVANPLTLWGIGNHVILGDASQAYWDGGAYQVGVSPVPASRFAVANEGTIASTNYDNTDLNAGYVCEFDFSVDALGGDQVVAGVWGGDRRFCLQVGGSGNVQHRQLTDPNSLVGVTSSVSIVPGVQYHAILRWTPGTVFSIDIDGTLNSGTAVPTLRGSTAAIVVGARSGSPFTDFFTGFVQNFLLTPIAGQSADLDVADSGVGAIGGATWTDQFGVDWEADGDVIASEA